MSMHFENDYEDEDEDEEQESGKNMSYAAYRRFMEEEQGTPTIKDGLFKVRGAIRRLEEAGLVLSELPADDLKMLLFSKDVDKAIDKVTKEMTRDQVSQLFHNDVKSIVQDGIPVTLDDNDQVDYDVSLLRSKIDRLAEIFDSEEYNYPLEVKKKLVLDFISKVDRDITREEFRGNSYDKSSLLEPVVFELSPAITETQKQRTLWVWQKHQCPAVVIQLRLLDSEQIVHRPRHYKSGIIDAPTTEACHVIGW